MRTGLTKQEKTTDILFDEKDQLIHIRTHNTALKKRLAAYAGQHPDQCRQTDADPETGCMEFEIRKGPDSRCDSTDTGCHQGDTGRLVG